MLLRYIRLRESVAMTRLHPDYNDKTLGNIFEAVLGVAWLCRHGHMACELWNLHTLDEYTLAFE